MREIILIAAVGPELLIGDGNRLPWRLPRDFRLFRRLTVGHPIVMGRKTFESLNSRPLPKRRNIVVTRNLQFAVAGVDVAHSIEQAIESTPDGSRVFVVGGGQLYEQSMPLATSVILTQIFDENPNANLFDLFSGDVYFPKLSEDQWLETKASNKSYLAISSIAGHRVIKRKGLRFRVRRFVRLGANVPQGTRLSGTEVNKSLVISREHDNSPEQVVQAHLFK